MWRTWLSALTSCSDVSEKPNASESAIGGLVGGLTAVSLIFPLYKLMSRQMLYGTSFSASCAQYKSEGARFIFRGVVPPLLMKGMQGANMFGVKSYVTGVVEEVWPEQKKRSYQNVVAGGIAGSVDFALFVPFERVQTLLLATENNQNPSVRSTYAATRQVIRNGGIRELYRAGPLGLTRNVMTTIMYMEFMDSTLAQQGKKTFSENVFNFVTGGIVGGSISSLFHPFNVVRIKIQSEIGGGKPPDYKRTLMHLVHENDGWLRLWKGVHINFFRASISWGIIFCVQNNVSKHLKCIRQGKSKD